MTTTEMPDVGIYEGVTYEEYNSWPCHRKSNLFILDELTPAHYRWAVDHPEETMDLEHYRVGHAAHTAVLEPGAFDDRYAVKPTTYVNDKGEEKPWSGNANICKAIMEELAATGKTILSQDDYDLSMAIGDALREKPNTRLMLEHGKPEVSIVWNDEQTGLRMKARIDEWVESVGQIIDLKTTAFPASIRRFGSASAKYGYPMQMALYHDGMVQITGKEIKMPVLWAVEKDHVRKIGTKAVAVYQLTKEDLEIGRCQYQYILERIQRCEESGEWPGYPDEEPMDLVMPSWYGMSLNAG